MQRVGINRYNATCKVCYDAGQHHLCNTHKPKGEVFHQGKGDVIQAGWKIIKEFGQVSLCPVLQNTVCTNPQCFNGQNGVIRFSCFGHSISHCPCEWPQGWEIGGPMEHMRYTGYTPQQWEQFSPMEHVSNCELIRQIACQPLSSMEHVSNCGLVRQIACQSFSSMEENTPTHPLFPISPLVRQIAYQLPLENPEIQNKEVSLPFPLENPEIHNKEVSLPIPLENPETQKEVMELKEKTRLLTQEVELLRKKLQEKQEKQEQSSPKQQAPKLNWAEEMCGP